MNKEKFAETLKESKVLWRIKKYANDKEYAEGNAYEESEFEGNVMLNEGIDELWTLVAGTGGTAFDNTNAYIGVGDDGTTAADATQTGLQGSNKLYKGMESGYPTYGTSQKATWQASFGASEANFSWQEFTVANGNSDSAINLNRKVSDQGSKTNGQTWTIEISITLS